MKKVIVWVGILAILVFGVYALNTDPINIHNETLNKPIVMQGIPIIDIRTKKEWQETGTVLGSHLITFYQEDNSFDETKFMLELEKVVSKDDTFAILCRSGNRSNQVSRFLYAKGFTHVINLTGGIKMGIKNGIELISR